MLLSTRYPIFNFLREPCKKLLRRTHHLHSNGRCCFSIITDPEMFLPVCQPFFGTFGILRKCISLHTTTTVCRLTYRNLISHRPTEDHFRLHFMWEKRKTVAFVDAVSATGPRRIARSILRM